MADSDRLLSYFAWATTLAALAVSLQLEASATPPAAVLAPGATSHEVPLKPELERAAKVRMLALACREFRPELAERVDRAFNDWWEQNSPITDEVHALYFGTQSAEQAAVRQAFEDLEHRLRAQEERSRDANPDMLADRCRHFVERLEGETRSGRTGPADLPAGAIR